MTRQRLICVGVLAYLLLLASPTLGGEDREQLIAMARDGNRAAIQSIATMECRYERRPWGKTTLEQAVKLFALQSPGRLWRSGEVYRHFRPMGDGTTMDAVVRDGRGLFLRKGGPMPQPQVACCTMKPVDGMGGEMWKWLLFSLWAQVQESHQPFHEILEKPHVIRTAERLGPPANDIHIKLTHVHGRLELWFDPKVNYLVRKSVMVPEGFPQSAPEWLKALRWEEEVVEFMEGAPAVFVPIVVEHRCYVKETLQATIRTILSEVKINQPLAENALRLPGIAGTECVDMDRDVKFKVNADGIPIGPESPIQIARTSPNVTSGGSIPLASGDPNAYLEPSRPPTSWWMWILIASLTVLTASLVLAVVRRRRQAMQS